MVSRELPYQPEEIDSLKEIRIESNFEHFVPEEFTQNPIHYFEQRGRNIKPGVVKRDESGTVREDPTAVKEFPIWTDTQGNQINVIGKRVNIEKAEVGESGDPFYEYEVMQTVRSVGLPAVKPVATVEQQHTHIIIMERAVGLGWYEITREMLQEYNYTEADIGDLHTQANLMMEELKLDFAEAGIIRGWKLKDMIFDIDLENKKINSITPTDWERTKIDTEQLERYKSSLEDS